MLNPKLYFDLWSILEHPERFPFMKILADRDDLILLQNTLVEDVCSLICISDSAVNLRDYVKVPGEKKILLSLNTETADYRSIIGESDAANLVEQSNCYERLHRLHDEVSRIPDGLAVRKISDADLVILKNTPEEDPSRNYTRQIIDLSTDDSFEVYALTKDGQAASFLVLKDLESAHYALKYKYVSIVYTLPAFRENGLAKTLLDSVLRQYSTENFLYTADSWQNTASNKLAQSCGFVPFGHDFVIEISLRTVG